MPVQAPKIDIRTFKDIVEKAKEIAPFYTPEWNAENEKDAGSALLKLFSHMLEAVITRLNQVPRKNFIAFLDMLGIKLLPAQAAKVPLTFKLAQGTEKEILVPARTQAAADETEEHAELPFETEKNLLATPSMLKKVYSVDPHNDAIYIPPPGFLNGSTQKRTEVTYKIVSAASAGAKNLQLDHVTDLEEGDFLKIGSSDEPDYVIIAGISGTIVSITDKLSQSHPTDTPVNKITTFTLFEAKNMQEHSLYLGHSDLFNIKSTAMFNLEVTHQAGTVADVVPFEMSWEYWGEIEGEKGEDWRRFGTIDKTNGLSKDGLIELTKTTEGEIKEKEINGQKSRWIRCLLEQPLIVDAPHKLPVLDNITFVVKSSGENLMADQAFNNEIPLDISQPFTPFGNEPRMFDRFSLASKEIFSKKGAKIDINIEFESRGILGPPTAIAFTDLAQKKEKIKVFARGTYGRLVEVEIDPSGTREPEWRDHGFPPGTKIASESKPSVEKYPSEGSTGDYISVFARAEKGNLVERHYNGYQWLWIDHGPPKEGLFVNHNPSPIIYGNNTVGYSAIFVFVGASDGRLYEFSRHPNKMVGTWFDHGTADDMSIASSAYSIYAGVTSDYKILLKIFVKGQDGKLYELECQANSTSRSDKWVTDYGSPSDSVFVGSRPFAQGYNISGDSYAKVFVKDTDDALWEFDTQTKVWGESLGVPSGDEENSIKVDSAPHGFINKPGSDDRTEEDKHIFVRGSDNCLWERTDVEWIAHQAPGNLELDFSPFVLYFEEKDYSHIYSASSQNSIIERESRLYNSKKIWNEYKDPVETALNPILTWEYWNQKGWVVLKGLKDETANFLRDGKITFDLPEDIEKTEIAGQESYWIRARIVGGDYGKETFSLEFTQSQESRKLEIEQKLLSSKISIRPPIVKSLMMSYAVVANQFPQQCLTYNNLDYLNQSEACKAEGKHFSPFVPLEDTDRTLYLGFEKYFKGGPIKIFFAAKELPYTEEKKPKLVWTYSAKEDWGELNHLDETEALIRREILELIGSSDFSAHTRFGNYIYWIKGTLTEGEYEESPLLDGIYPNTTWALQAETIRNEILGSSNGEPNQNFSFLKFPVLKVPEIRAREIPSEEEKLALISSDGENAIFEVRDEQGDVVETWVLWREVADFFDSTSEDRHYALDRATGQLQFGDGINGMIPPPGENNIKVFSYQAGGGAQGNVKVEEIKTLKTAVAGVETASNPIGADGGADTATLEQMLEIGPAMISHRNRAVAEDDFEWLAKQASRKVVKARCLPNVNNRKHTETGWVTVIIVPDSQEAKPFPSLELRKKVRQYLEAHSANTLTHAKHIHIDGPSYSEIGVTVNVLVTSIDVATVVEREVRTKLDVFFHPLTGGLEGKGWDFGRDVAASDIYVLLEEIDGIDHVENLKFTYNGTAGEDTVEIQQGFIVANGTHIINLNLANGE